MKWKSHQAVTAATVYAATGDVLAAVLSMQGSVWPDAIEMVFPFLRHRALSHWWPVYVLPMTLCYFLVLSKLGFFPDPFPAAKFILSGGFSFPLVLGELFFWSLLGALLHIPEDTLCGYIPITRPDQRWKCCHLFYVGSPKETTFVMAYVVLVLTGGLFAHL